jgi:hypothetical protein
MEPWPPPLPPPRRLRLRWFVLAFAIVLAVPFVFVGWFLFVAPADPAPYLARIESLEVPPTWEVVHTQALRSFLGSRAERYYLVDAEPADIAPVVEDVLRSAGLEIYDEVAPSDWCDQRPIGATPAITCPRKPIPTCRENGAGGPVSCWVQGFRWLSSASSLEASVLERVDVSVSPRGDSFDVGVNDQRHQIDGDNRALIVISADRTSARYFWSSPTPAAAMSPGSSH